MSFYLKYELSRLLNADGAKTFQAIEKATRRNVLLHLVDKSASPELIEKVRKLQAERERELLEVGEFAGSCYVVTDPSEEFAGFGAWLDLRILGVGAAPPAEPAPEVRTKAEFAAPSPPVREPPGEFTEFFGKAASAPPTPPPSAATRPVTSPTMVDLDEPAKARPLVPAVEEESGEFTRLFGEPSKPAARVDQPTPVPAEPPAVSIPEREAVPPTRVPGEFTSMFAGMQPETPPAAAPTPTARVEAAPAAVSTPAVADESGEFTRLFGGPAAAPSAPSAPVSRPPTPTVDSGSRGTPVDDGSGEFTKMFGAPRPAQAPAAASVDIDKGSGEFTRLFGGPPGKTEEPAIRLKPASQPREGDIEKNSGEFTRLFGPSGKGAPAAKGPKSPAPTPVPKLEPSPLEGSLGSSSGAPGDFTLMFGGGTQRQSTAFGDGAPLAARPPAASFGEGLVGEISGDEALAADKGPKVSKSSKPFQAPGEFTRMFGPSDPNQRPPEDFIPAARSGGGEGYASGLFRNPHSEPRQPSGAGGRIQPPPGPGDYTMTFERGAQPPVLPTSTAQAKPTQAAITPAAPASSGPSKGVLIALVAALLVAVLSLGAAVYLFLNRSAEAPGGETPPPVEQPAETKAN